MTRAPPYRIPSENDLPIRPSASSKLSTFAEVTTTESLQTQSANQAWWQYYRKSRGMTVIGGSVALHLEEKRLDSKWSARGRTLESRNIGQGTTDISGGTWDHGLKADRGVLFRR